ncbi:MAG: DNA polymerase III subunit alpha [Chloroflexota bacterium]
MNERIASNFTHLHVHSQFSLLEGHISIDQLVQQGVANGVNALALTDTHALYGAVAFHQACTAVSIKPIIGMSVWVKSPVTDAMPLEGEGQLVLLATGPEGYRSLCKLSSFLQTGEPKTAVSWQALSPFKEGLIGIDAAHAGWTSRYLTAGQPQAASRFVSFLGGLFEENGYLGMALNSDTDLQLADDIIKVGSRFGVQAVALQSTYCLKPEDQATLKLLAAIDENCLLEEVPPSRLPTHHHQEVHWLTPHEVTIRFEAFPEALAAVEKIVAQCKSALPDGRPIWPKLSLPEAQTEAHFLREQAQKGLTKLYGRSPSDLTQARLEKELEMIVSYGFAPLFVLVSDITRFARETAVPFNTRGSVANSLVAYCIGITNVDPIEHDLLFERFLNPARANMPDIDLDFCSRRRDEVLRYVREKYGEEKVALVATINTLQPKSAVRETAKAFGFKESDIKKMTSQLPRGWHPDPERREKVTLENALRPVTDSAHRRVIKEAFGLIGQPHHMSIHPGGVVIAPDALTDFVPVQMAPKGFLITQFDYRDIEKIGLPKIDLLGIRALTVLADTVELIDSATPFDLSTMPLQDAETAVILEKGDTIGVFQCESTGAQRTMRQLKTKTVADLAVANAFFKPGPATGGMAQAFIRRYREEEVVTYLHTALAPILGSTKGVMLFQEQVLRIATEVAQLSWNEADHLRRGMSKFKADEMAQMKQRFVDGCQTKSGFEQAQAETLWDQIMAFAGYGFNQGHATAYADISYRSAYMRAHYPAEFLTARLKDHGGFHHPAIYMAEARRLGFEVRPPHVNFSERKFSLGSEIGDPGMGNEKKSPIAQRQSKTLWMGLGQVRDLRRKTVREIVSKRPFSSVQDLLRRVPMQTKEAVHLVKCGALDGLGESRAAMLADVEGVARAGNAGQLAFGFAVETAVLPETLAERLDWEKQLLGLPMSNNPIDLFEDQTKDDVPIGYLNRLKNMKTTIAGVRLPGWTGGKGFYFSDGKEFVVVRLDKSVAGNGRVSNWYPIRLTGYWRIDEWGGGWFQAIKTERLEVAVK